MNRRTLLGGIAATGAIGAAGLALGRRGVEPSALAREIADLRKGDLPGWLHGRIAAGIRPGEVLTASMLAGAARCGERGDLHHLLVAGPAERLGPISGPERLELVLWALHQQVEWLGVEACDRPPDPPPAGPADPAAWTEALEARDPERAAAELVRLPGWASALAAAISPLDPDPHPTALAAEVVHFGGRLAPADRAILLRAAARRLAAPPATDVDRELWRASIAARARELAADPPRSADPTALADQIRSGDPEDALDRVVGLGAGRLWEALWLAAAQRAERTGLPLNGIHAGTVTWALQRLARASADPAVGWALALTGVVRLCADAADPADGRPDGTADRAAWVAAGARPGIDVHDLKYREAMIGGADAWGAAVLAAAGGLAQTSRWPEFEELRERFRALGPP